MLGGQYLWTRTRLPARIKNNSKKKRWSPRSRATATPSRTRPTARGCGPGPPPADEPQQVDALLTWVENLWRELKIKEEDRQLFLEANNLPSRNLVDRLQRTVYAELVSEPTKRPKSASASRPKTAPFPDARRQKDVDQRCAPLAAHARLLLDSGGLRYERCGRSSPEKSSSNESRTASEGIGAHHLSQRGRSGPPPFTMMTTSPAAIVRNADQGGFGRPESDFATVKRSHGARRRRRRGVAVLSMAARTFSLEGPGLPREMYHRSPFSGRVRLSRRRAET